MDAVPATYSNLAVNCNPSLLPMDSVALFMTFADVPPTIPSSPPTPKLNMIWSSDRSPFSRYPSVTLTMPPIPTLMRIPMIENLGSHLNFVLLTDPCPLLSFALPASHPSFKPSDRSRHRSAIFRSRSRPQLGQFHPAHPLSRIPAKSTKFRCDPSSSGSCPRLQQGLNKAGPSAKPLAGGVIPR